MTNFVRYPTGPSLRARIVTLAVIACLIAPAFSGAAAPVPKWEKFEATFESALEYANPVQDAPLVVTFTAPSGRMLKVPGFWDGGKTWRVRFAPNEVGKWSYRTTCPDEKNTGLHGQSGEFECGPPTGRTRFTQHGPVRVAHDGRYLEHEDGTPFFFLADTAWNGPLLSTEAEWAHYIATRRRQAFNAVQWVTTQWRAAPEGDRNKDLAFTGSTNLIRINPKFFERLDQKAEALAQAGFLNVPVLLWAIAAGSNPAINPGHSLSEHQAIHLARYMVARWQHLPVLWILAGDGDYRGQRAERWKRIGRAVFNDIAHAPVTMHPGGMQWIWSDFKDEKWYDVVGYQSGHGDDDQTLRWMTEGPLTEDWTRLPHRPFINLEPPYENHVAYQSKKPISPEVTRRAIYWTLLNNPTAGVTYGGHGVWGWDDGTKPPTDHPNTGTPLPLDKALVMPGAEQMRHLQDFFTSIDFHRLRPAPIIVVNNPGKDKPEKFIAAAKTDRKDLGLVYVPEDRTVEIKLDALPPSPNITWINPRTGERSPAVAVVTANTCQFPTPAEGDWLLLMQSQKEEKKTEAGSAGGAASP
ncbi:MAG TPA: DUF4038 domain-containing protein [Methylomirabilota bacterium]|nr:DUF4038 domain-containing protein [Methylomirabilota bacterium]